MRHIPTSIPFWVLSTTVVLAASAGARGDILAGPELGRVDFRYAPPWWQSAICLPDDPDKILVGKEGQVLLEFGHGGMRNFGIVLQPEINSGTTWVKQQTISPRTPILQTYQGAAGVELFEETFVVIPRSDSPAARLRIVRVDGYQRLTHWAQPARPCPTAFTGADVAYGGKPIQLRLIVPAGAERTLVFGLCEGWHEEPGRRPLILQTEGSPPSTVDPVKDFGPNQPGLYRRRQSTPIAMASSRSACQPRMARRTATPS